MLKKTTLGFVALLLLAGCGLNSNALRPTPTQTKKSRLTLHRADSLFAAGHYAAAAPLYQAVVGGQRLASPRLLLRLAYARQQQGRTAAALLALSQAQAQKPRLRTWQHMAALAARQHLVGYPSTWQQELRVRAQAYYYPGLQGLLLAAVAGTGVLLLRRRPTPPAAWAWLATYLGLIGLYLHVLRPAPTALLVRPGAALMAGPSAGAAWLNTATVGDRLLVLGQQDIWYQVEWQERIGFVRKADLLVIEE